MAKPQTEAQKEAAKQKAAKAKIAAEKKEADAVLSKQKEAVAANGESKDQTKARHEKEEAAIEAADAKKKKLNIDHKSKIKFRSDEELEDIATEQNLVAEDNGFKDSDTVIVKGTDDKKFSLSPKSEFEMLGVNAKKLIHKGAAKFVKIVKPKKKDK